MINGAIRKVLVASLLVLLTASCGGGGGDGTVASGGIGGTGISHGSVTGFGSIFVNGSRLNVSNASITIDDTAASEDEIKLGMVVTAIVDLSSSAAIIVEADGGLDGPITSAPQPDADGNTKTFTVLGTTVVVEKNDTVFDNADPSFNFDTIALNDIVDIHGFFDNMDQFIAKRIERKGVFSGAPLPVEVKGTIEGLVNGSNVFSFQIRALTITGDAATDLSDVPGGLANGLFVEVKGDLQSDGTVHANSVELEGLDQGIEVDEVSAQGIVTDCPPTPPCDNFTLNTGVGPVPVRILPGATFEPVGLVLTNGLEVEVEGRVNNGVLEAFEVEARGGDIKIEATVVAVDPQGTSQNGTVELAIAPDPMNPATTQTLVVHVNQQTRTEDDTGADPTPPSFDLGDIGQGDFLEIRAFKDGTGDIIATRLERDDPDDVILQGAKDDYSANTGTGVIRLLDIEFATNAATQFEDADDNPVATLADFDGLVQSGVCALVKVKDKDDVPVDGLGDGTADEVDCEN